MHMKAVKTKDSEEAREAAWVFVKPQEAKEGLGSQGAWRPAAIVMQLVGAMSSVHPALLVPPVRMLRSGYTSPALNLPGHVSFTEALLIACSNYAKGRSHALGIAGLGIDRQWCCIAGEFPYSVCKVTQHLLCNVSPK